MPKVFKQTARTDIYAQGARIEANTKQGYKIDRSKPFYENDMVIVPKGSVYYMWAFRFGPTYRSLTHPKPSQLTQSEFLQRAYKWNENPIVGSSISELEEEVQNRISEIEELRDETQDKLDNMPEQLQYAPTGEMLQNRIDSLEEMISDFEAIDFDEEREIDDVISDIKYVTYNGE